MSNGAKRDVLPKGAKGDVPKGTGLNGNMLSPSPLAPFGKKERG